MSHQTLNISQAIRNSLIVSLGKRAASAIIEALTEAKSQSITIAASDETTDLAVTAGAATFRMPHSFALSEVRASVTTAPTDANIIVDINAGGVSILTTEINIDAGKKTSINSATPAIIGTTSFAEDVEIKIDIDQIGSTIAGTGLKVTLIGS